MDNNDNCEFVYNIERRIREDEEEFIYTIIKPFCETVVEKKLSKAELKQILEKGMQKSIPLEKVKKAKKKMTAYIEPTTGQWTSGFNNGVNTCLEILDELISEVEK